MKKIFYTLLFLLPTISLFSQNNVEQRIVVLSKNYGDSVVIRWAPTSPSLWLACNKTGYRLEKVIEYQDGIDEDSIPIIKERYEPVRNEVFKPLPLEAMIKRYEDEKHPMGMIATEFLYGDIDLRGEDHGFLSTITAEAEAQNMRFAYTLFSADLDADVADALGLRYSFKTKGIKDSTLIFRLISLVDTTQFASDTLYITIDVFEKDINKIPPRDLYTEGGDKFINLHWVRDRNYSAYYIERSTDSINFTPLNKEPFLTSSAEGEEIKAQYLPDTNFTDTTSYQALTPMPLHEYNVYVDSVQNGIKYYYRVYGIDAFGDKSDYSEIVSGKGEEAHPLLPPSEVKAEILPNGRIKITWKEPEDKTKLQGYLVAHANEFGQDQYNLVTEELIPPGTTECYHNNVKEGSYNIYIVSSIDDRGRFVKSSPVSVYISDSLPPLPPKGVKAIIDSTGLCLISWDVNEEDDIAGYKVYSSYDPNGTFNQITNYKVETNAFLDKVNIEFLNRKIYYRVIAVDEIGNHSEFSDIFEAVIPDIHPPITPVVNSFFVRDNGVDIRFIVGNDVDAKVYHIMRKTDTEDFSIYKSLSLDDVNEDNSIDYKDTIRNEGYYEYALQVEDEAGLKSNLSQIIPVTIKKREGADVLMKIEASYSSGSNSVIIKWKRPNNIVREKFHYVLYKREANGSWQMYDSINKDNTEYIDKKVVKGKSYEYKVVPFAEGVSIGNGEVFTVNVK